MLRLNNKPIWNIVDLKKNFSPTEIYRQKNEFLRFAKVHCMLLCSKFVDSENETYEAFYLTKDFWYKILSFVCDDFKKENEWLEFFLEKRIKEELGNSSDEEELRKIKEEAEKEIKDAAIGEKLAFIYENGNLKQSDEDGLKALILLAICEIAEIDAREQNFAIPVSAEKDKKAQKIVKDIIFDGETKVVSLVASQTRYRVRLFEENSLPSGSSIRTIRLESVAGVNKYENVIFDFYDKNNICIHTVQIRPGEYRYINVVGNEVVGFLPSVSIEKGCCVYRNGYGSKNIKIATGNNQARTVSKNEYETFVSVGEKAGAILVRNGKLVTDYCTVSVDFRTKLILDMLIASFNVAEVAFVDDTIKVLTDSGKVYSILSFNGDAACWLNASVKTPEAENVVTLNEKNRIGNMRKTSEDILESAVSSDGAENADLLRSGECRINYR